MPLLDDLSAPVLPEELERRRFLGLLGAGALGAAAVGTVITTVRYLEPAVLFEEDVRFPVGRPQDVAPGTVLVFLKEKVYVVHGASGFYALSSVCTHLGCVTRWGQEPGRFSCPCHGSRFALDGRVAGGPAPRPLRRVLLTLEAGQLVVDARRVVADDFLLVVA